MEIVINKENKNKRKDNVQTLIEVFLNVEASFHVVVVLLLMHMFATRGGRRTHWSASVSEMIKCKIETIATRYETGTSLVEHLQNTHIILVQMS